MPPRRGRHIVDENSVTPIPGSATPLSSIDALDDGKQTTRRGGAIKSVGVTSIEVDAAPSSAQGKVFTIPAAVLQRMPMHANAHYAAAPMVAATAVEPSTDGTGNTCPPSSSLKVSNDAVDSTDAAEEETDDLRVVREHQASANAKKRTGKPLIMSRRWNRRGKDGEEAAADPEETGRHALSSFANCNDDVIQFGRKPTHDSQDIPHMSCTSSEEGSWSDEDDDEGDWKEKKRRQREQHHRQRVESHMAGYDEVALQQEEEALLQSAEVSESDASSNNSEDDEENEYGSSSDSGRSDSSHASDAEETAQQGSSGGGFGARERVAEARQAEYRRRANASPPAGSSSSGTTEEKNAYDLPAAAPLAHRHRFGHIYYETHLNSHDSYPCHHTMLCLRGQVTIEGPCGVVGLGVGEASLGGFLMGKKQVVLWSKEQRAVLMPFKKSKQSSQGASASKQHALASSGDVQQGVVASVDPVHAASQVQRLLRKEEAAAGGSKSKRAGGGHEDADGEDDDDDQDVEMVFGNVDWDWVGRTLTAWRQLFANQLPSLVLVIHPYTPGRHGTRKHFLKGKSKRNKRARREEEEWLRTATAEERARHDHSDSAYIEIPSFLSRHGETNIDLALLPDIVPRVANQATGSVVVVGSQNIGKSTLCRFLANTLLSRQGVCFWLDLDLGQPEFGVPGQIALHRVRRPLLRAQDRQCAEQVCAYFLGSTTVSCPLSAANAIAAMCDVVAKIAKQYPVVVNTHGWVLSTGRRSTVEVVRRLLPQSIIHLLRATEDAWARRTDELLNPSLGLNADVVGRRFLVRDFTRPNSSGDQAQHLLCHLPYAAAKTASGSSSASAPQPPSSVSWTGAVHTVRVNREDGPKRGKAEPKKGSYTRQQQWQQYLSPLLAFYENTEEDDAPQTTLLRAPLRTLHRIALALSDEKHTGELSLVEVSAMLEHSVVAVQVGCPCCGTSSSPRRGGGNKAKCCSAGGALVTRDKKVAVSSLARMPTGFPVTCYGYVESGEDEMSGANGLEPTIAIRLPIAPPVMQQLLTATSSEGAVYISIAISPTTQTDTHFMEDYPYQ